jgi:hypothetical protein
MAEALDPAATIYEGTWTDWSKSSKALGWTWTLCPEHAVLVTNALAVFVTLTGSQLWSITRFTLHQVGAKSLAASPSTPNHKKEQVILRNATTDLNTARLMAYLAWRSKRRGGKTYPRTVSIAVFALLHAILFMAAGTFSNNAISAGGPQDGSMVLSRSKHCGVWNETYINIAGSGFADPSNEDTFRLTIEYIAKQTHNVQLSIEYAQKCYLAEDSYDYMSSVCNTLKQPKLEWTTTNNNSCPFGAGVCRSDAGVVVMDTGDIDTHDDLGINAPPDERLKYRRITQCAVLNDTGRVTGWDGVVEGNRAGPSPNQTSDMAKALYGPSLYKGTDWTYAYSNFAQFFNNFSVQTTPPYQVDAETAWAYDEQGLSTSDFEPIPEVAQEHADLILFFLSYTGTYASEVHDPWFSATRDQAFDGSPELLETRYARDSAISTLACTEQHRFCTNKGICTAFGGFDQVQYNPSFNSTLTANQNATFNRMLLAATAGALKAVVQGLAVTSTPLLANSHVAVGSTVTSLGLPDNQWERELEYWHAIAMAQLQRTVVQYATGQVAPQPQYLLPPTLPQDKWYCHNLMIPSTVYQSFSILKIILIILFGTIIIVLSLNIEAVARQWRKLFKKNGAAEDRTDWEHDDMLKLRMDMRESLWPPTLPSPGPPPPPPKSPHYQAPIAPPRPGRSPEIRTTVRAVSISPDSDRDDNDWKRSSSPTLPLDDRAISVLSKAARPQDSNYLVAPDPIYKGDRDSWMAISLNDLAATSSAVPVQNSVFDDIEQQRFQQDSRSAQMMQRLRSPMQFHLPRPQASWV